MRRESLVKVIRGHEEIRGREPSMNMDSKKGMMLWEKKSSKCIFR